MDGDNTYAKDPVTQKQFLVKDAYSQIGDLYFENLQSQQMYFSMLKKGFELRDGRLQPVPREKVWVLQPGNSDGPYALITSKVILPLDITKVVLQPGKYTFYVIAPQLADGVFSLSSHRHVLVTIQVTSLKSLRSVLAKQTITLTPDAKKAEISFEIRREDEHCEARMSFTATSTITKIRVESYIEKEVVSQVIKDIEDARYVANKNKQPDEYVVELERDAKGMGMTIGFDQSRGCAIVKSIDAGGVAARTNMMAVGDEIRSVQGIACVGERIQKVVQLVRNVPLTIILTMKRAPVGWSPADMAPVANVKQGNAPQAPPVAPRNKASRPAPPIPSAAGASRPPPPRPVAPTAVAVPAAIATATVVTPPEQTAAVEATQPPIAARRAPPVPPPTAVAQPISSAASSSATDGRVPPPRPQRLTRTGESEPSQQETVSSSDASVPPPIARRPAPPLPAAAVTNNDSNAAESLSSGSVQSRPAPPIASRRPAPPLPAPTSQGARPPPVAARPAPPPPRPAPPAAAVVVATSVPAVVVEQPQPVVAPPPPPVRAPTPTIPAEVSSQSVAQEASLTPMSTPSASGNTFGPEYERFYRMKKSGLPEGAILNAMNREGVKPPPGFFSSEWENDAAKPVKPLVIAPTHHDDNAGAKASRPAGAAGIMGEIANFKRDGLKHAEQNDDDQDATQSTASRPAAGGIMGELANFNRGALKKAEIVPPEKKPVSGGGGLIDSIAGFDRSKLKSVPQEDEKSAEEKKKIAEKGKAGFADAFSAAINKRRDFIADEDDEDEDNADWEF